MERETIKKTIGKHEIEIKTYATPREINALRQFELKEGQLNTVEHEKVLIEQLVVSINGQKENLVDFVLDNFDFATEYVPLLTELAQAVSKKK